MAKKHKYPQKIILPFKEGDYISKKNHDLFNIGWNGNEIYIPSIPIRQAVPIGNGKWMINNRFCFDNIKTAEIVTKEKAEELIAFFNSLKLTEPESLSIDETCYTTYSGVKQEKHKVKSIKSILNILYKFSLERPTEGFQAYSCPNCGFYHTGRIKNKITETT